MALEKFSVPVYKIFPCHYHSKIDSHSFFLNPPPMQYDIRHCSFVMQNFSLALAGLPLLRVPSTFSNTLRGFNVPSHARLNNSAHTHTHTRAHTHTHTHVHTHTHTRCLILLLKLSIWPCLQISTQDTITAKRYAVKHYKSVYKSNSPTPFNLYVFMNKLGADCRLQSAVSSQQCLLSFSAESFVFQFAV